MNKVLLHQQDLINYYNDYSTVINNLNKKIPKVLSEKIWIYVFDVDDNRYNSRWDSIVKALYEICKENNNYWDVYNRECINRCFKEYRLVDDINFIHKEIGNLKFCELDSLHKTFYGRHLKHKHFIYHQNTKTALIVGETNLKNFLKITTAKCSKCSKTIITHKKIKKKNCKTGEIHKTIIPPTCEECKKKRDTRSNKKSHMKFKKVKTIANIEVEYIKYRGYARHQCRKNKCSEWIEFDLNFCKKHH